MNNNTLYQFEKNKLYDLLGKGLVSTLKEHKCYIAGGAITSLFTSSKVNDFDVYFRDEKSCINFIEDMWDQSEGWVNVLTKKSALLKINDLDIQLIHFKYFNTAEEIFDTFDFTVCMGAFDFESEQFILQNDFMKHNSQRILKFNKNTSFPIVSLLLVQKYNKKSYTISKPEFLRIAMRCMDLKINNVEELKDHLGGMYGINYDKIVNFSDGEEFSLDKVIDKIENIVLDEEYFKKPVEQHFDDLDDIIETIRKCGTRITYIKDKLYKIRYNGTLKPISTKPTHYEEIDGKDHIEKMKFYKFVNNKEGDTYRSFWDRNFTYEIGKVATAKNEYLYFNEKAEIDKSSYKSQGALLEVTIDYDDFRFKDSDKIHAKRCTVIREVRKEEYDTWNTSDNNDGCDPFAGWD